MTLNASFRGMPRTLHMPQIDTKTNEISCMKDGCPWTYPEPGDGAQESFEKHLEPDYFRSQP